MPNVERKKLIETSLPESSLPVINPEVYETNLGLTYLREPGVAVITVPHTDLRGLEGFFRGFPSELNFPNYLNDPTNLPDAETLCKFAGQLCYLSFGVSRTDNKNAKQYFKNILESGHGSVLEHANITARVVCDRGVGNELVRHRLASYSQESTRYVNYGKGEIAFIQPPLQSMSVYHWRAACQVAEGAYLSLLANGETPEIARSVLPLCLKTEIVITANLREWRHIFRVRVCNKAAHPQIRYVLGLGLAQMKLVIPIVFDDLETIP